MLLWDVRLHLATKHYRTVVNRCRPARVGRPDEAVGAYVIQTASSFLFRFVFGSGIILVSFRFRVRCRGTQLDLATRYILVEFL